MEDDHLGLKFDWNEIGDTVQGRCAECGRDFKWKHYYMVSDATWKAAGMRGFFSGYLHLRCLERRFERRVRDDELRCWYVRDKAPGDTGVGSLGCPFIIDGRPEWLESPECRRAFRLGRLKQQRELLEAMVKERPTHDPEGDRADRYTPVGELVEEIAEAFAGGKPIGRRRWQRLVRLFAAEGRLLPPLPEAAKAKGKKKGKGKAN
jgi:hypothetical protein